MLEEAQEPTLRTYILLTLFPCDWFPWSSYLFFFFNFLFRNTWRSSGSCWEVAHPLVTFSQPGLSLYCQQGGCCRGASSPSFPLELSCQLLASASKQTLAPQPPHRPRGLYVLYRCLGFPCWDKQAPRTSSVGSGASQCALLGCFALSLPLPTSLSLWMLLQISEFSSSGCHELGRLVPEVVFESRSLGQNSRTGSLASPWH